MCDLQGCLLIQELRPIPYGWFGVERVSYSLDEVSLVTEVDEEVETVNGILVSG